MVKCCCKVSLSLLGSPFKEKHTFFFFLFRIMSPSSVAVFKARSSLLYSGCSKSVSSSPRHSLTDQYGPQFAAASMGLDVRFSIYFHGPCVFPPYKDSLCPTVSPRDGLHSLLLLGRGKDTEREREGRNEGGKEGAERGGKKREEAECGAAVKDMAA